MTKLRALIAASLMFAATQTAARAGQEACCLLSEGFVAGRLLVTFVPGTQLETAQQIAVETRTEVIRYLFDLGSGPVYYMQVPVERELDYVVLFETLPEVVRANPDGISCAPILPACSCCPVGVVCPTLLPCVGLHPVEITLDRSPTDGGVVIRWESACTFGDETDYAVYEGAIGDYDSHTRIRCTDEVPALEETLAPSAASHYYLVVPHNGGVEGSLGTDGRKLERIRGVDVCLPTRTFTPCPS